MKNKFLLIALAAIIGFSFASLSLTGCDDGGGTTTVPVTGVTLNQSSISLNVSGSATLIATVTPDNAKNKTVSWSTSNPAAATVSNGVVTAVAAGTATITVTTADGGKTATCTVTVTGGNSGTPDLSGNITINPSTGVNINTELTATYSGSETVSYQWKKVDANVGTNSNKFTPTTAGSYTVTVSATGYNSKTSAVVDVNDPSLLTLSGTITISPNSGVTVNTQLTATYSGSETVSYQWEKDGSSVGTNSNKYTPTTAGSYTVTVSVEGYNSKTSNAVTVTGGGTSGTPITSVAITVTAPEKDEVPATTATASGTVNYTIGTVTWSPTDNPYQGGKQYTVTVTLTAESGYTFTGLTAATVNGQTATISNNTGETVRLSHTFPATNTKSVMAIGVQFQPSKMSYNQEDKLNLAGLIIQIIYTDSTTESVPLANFTSRNITTSPANGATLSVTANNGNPVTITYGSHTVDTGSLTVNPIAPVLTDFTVIGTGEFAYDGTVRTVTVTAKEGKTTGIVSNLKYNGTTTAPTYAGTYPITIDVTADANYTALIGFSVGTLTILTDANSTTYVITGSGASFTVTKGGVLVGTENQPIQTVIDAIRTNAAGNARTIQFGNGTDVLDIGNNSASFNSTGGTWGLVTLTGKMTSSNSTSTAGTIVIAGTVSVTSTAEIANTVYGNAVYNTSTGAITISGGTVSATSGYAVYNYSSGAVSISGGTVSVTTGSAVYNTSTGAITISGGTVSATSGYAVSNGSTGKITVSGTAKVTSENGQSSVLGTISNSGTLEITGGMVENTAGGNNRGNAVKNDGTVTISGGTVSSRGSAVYNRSSNGKITISGGTVTGSRAVENSYGTTTISGGTVTSNVGTAVENSSSGTLTISGGTVSGYDAVYNSSTGTVNISGGTVSASAGYAVYNSSTGKITVSGTALVTSANTNTAQGTIYLTDNGTATAARLEITGGTVENTSTTTGNAIRNDSTGAASITGGTVSKAGDGNYAVYKGGTGAVTIGAGATIVGNNYGL